MKIAPSTSAAITSNEKTFPIFARKLASGEERDFTVTTHKLTVWLNSEKAYYAAARPKIVELLEIALKTFMDTFIHSPAVAILSENLRKLVQVVIPFSHLFSEVELQKRLECVIIDTNTSISRAPTSSVRANASQESVPDHITISPLQTPTSLGRPQPTSIPAVLGPQEPDWRTQLSLSSLDTGKTDLDHSLRVDMSPNNNGVIPGPSSPALNTAVDSGGNTPTTVSSKPQPKRTRRSELFEDLVARDLDWFRSKQNPVTTNGDPNISSSKMGESLPSQTTDTSHIPRQSPTPKMKPARMVPSRRLPPRIPSAGLEVSSISPLISEAPAVESEFIVKDEIPIEEVSQLEVRSFVEPPTISIPSEPSIEPEIQMVNQQVSSGEASFPNAETPTPVHSSPPPPRTFVDTTEPMDISTSDLDPKNHLSDPPSPLLQFSPTLQLTPPSLPPVVTAMEPPLDLNFSVSHLWSERPEESVDNASHLPFSETTVIHTIQGKPFAHTHMIDISLNECTFSRISKWIHKRSQSEACQGVCISLACYHLSDIFHVVNKDGRHEVDGWISQTPCSWPSSNRLSLHVHNKERRTVVVLSPPLFLTPDQFVDISSLMQPGGNTLEVRQRDDLSQFLFVFLAHAPTPAQLTELGVMKIVDERWSRFLDALAWRTGIEKSELPDITPASVGVL